MTMHRFRKLFLPKLTLDEIHSPLARHFGLNAEELDFIINFYVKYRMGAELEDILE